MITSDQLDPEVRHKSFDTIPKYDGSSFKVRLPARDGERFVEVETFEEGVVLKVMGHNHLSGTLIPWYLFDQMQIDTRTDLEPDEDE